MNREPGFQSRIPDAKIVMPANSYSEVYEAVKAGIGVSLLSSLRLPQDHQLQALSPELYQFNMGLWLLSHPNLRNRERIKVFKAFVTEQFGSVLPQ